MPFRCETHINESIIESIGRNYLRVSKYGNGSYCTIKPDTFDNNNNIDTRLRQADILVVGDSHAHRQYYAINYAIQGAFEFRTLNLFGTMSCSYLFNFDVDDRCFNYRKYMRQIIETMRPAYLFFIAHMEEHISVFEKRFQHSNRDAMHNKLCSLYQNTIDFAEKYTQQRIVLVYPTPLFPSDVSLAVARAKKMGRNLDELRLKYDDYQSSTNRSRTCLDRIACVRCIRFYAHKAFCADDAQFCDVVDAKQRSLFDDKTHLSTFGIVRMQKSYLKLFDELASRI